MPKLTSILLIILATFWVIGSGKRIPSFAGPYRVIVRRVVNTSDEFSSTGNFWIRLYGSHPKLNEKQYVWGSTYNSLSLNDDFRIEVRISSWSNNQWKKNAFVMNFHKACSDQLHHAKPMVDLVFLPNERKCPLPAFGLREIKNQSFDATFPEFPIFPYGRYLFTVGYILNGETRGLLVAEAEVAPRL